MCSVSHMESCDHSTVTRLQCLSCYSIYSRVLSSIFQEVPGRLFLWFVIHRNVVWSPAFLFDFVYIFLVSLSINHNDSLIGLHFWSSLKCEVLHKCSRLLLLCDSSQPFLSRMKIKEKLFAIYKSNYSEFVISNQSKITKKAPLFHRIALFKCLNFLHNTVSPLASVEIFDLHLGKRRIRSLMSVRG